MNNIYDVLELCLQELENGAELETILARYSDHAGELRPILKSALMARSMAVPAPSPETVRRGRAKLLQHAAQMREVKNAPPKRIIPFFQRLAISFTLTALFLTSGTGLVSASSSALPGENLYPVKLTWENVRLFFTFNEDYRETLEHSFENERLHEVNELLVEGRHETIRFSGVYTEVNGITYVADIHIVLLDTSILPAEPLLNGAAVAVIGHTNTEGFVDVESIELLPAGSIVSAGQPVELKTGGDSGRENDNEDKNKNVNDGNKNSGNDNGNENKNVNGNESIDDNVNNNENGNDTRPEANANEDNSDSNGDNTHIDNGNSDDGGGNKDNNESGGGGGDHNHNDGEDGGDN